MASDGEAGEIFGAHTAIYGSRMVVGASRDNPHGGNSGSIYVFEYDGTNWTETEKISAYDGDPGDFYGSCVAMNGNFILVGARNDDDKGINAGAAYVYGSVTTNVPFDFDNSGDMTVFQLMPAYPNPFNPETTFRYSLPHRMNVEISIYNMLGQQVRMLENRSRARGTYSVPWDGRDETGNTLNSGIYICRIQAGEYRRTTKLTLLK